MGINKILIFIIVLVILVVTLGYKQGSRYLPMVYHKKEALRVACVGDSITYGARVKVRKLNSYPMQLQRLLGKDYYVENFGASGHTLMSSGDRPYISNKSFHLSQEFNPDIVVIMLGTNDAKKMNWTSVDEYIKDYKALISYYKTLASKPKIYIMTPPKAFPLKGESTVKFDIRNEALEEMTSAIKQLSEAEGIGLIDLNATISNHPEFFTFDGVHPDAKGASHIANTVFQSLIASK